MSDLQIQSLAVDSNLVTDDISASESTLLTNYNGKEHTKLDKELEDTDNNGKDDSEETILHVAVRNNNIELVCKELASGAQIDSLSTSMIMNNKSHCAPSPIRTTALLAACHYGYIDIATTLLAAGASITFQEDSGNTALHIAISGGHEDIVDAILQREAKCPSNIVNMKNIEHETPLHVAAREGDMTSVRKLLMAGASVEMEDSRGRTPLDLSVLENQVECVQEIQRVIAAAPAAVGLGIQTFDSANPEGSKLKPKESLEEGVGDMDETATSFYSGMYGYVDDMKRQCYDLINELQVEIMGAQEDCGDHLTKLDKALVINSDLMGDLKTEREARSDIEQRLAAKEAELQHLQIAHTATVKRCEMLQSIAERAQLKLKQERHEFAQTEALLEHKLHQALQTNNDLLASMAVGDPSWFSAYDRQSQSHHTEPKEEEYAYYEDQNAEYYTNQADVYDEAAYDEYEFYPSAVHEASTEWQDAQEGYSQDEQSKTNELPPAINEENIAGENEEHVPSNSESTTEAVWKTFFDNIGYDTGKRGSSQDAEQAIDQTYKNDEEVPAYSVFECIQLQDNEALHSQLLRGESPNDYHPNELKTAVHLACEAGNVFALSLLWEFGGDIELRDAGGNSCLLVACSHGNYDCVKFLLESACDLHVINDAGNTALHLAAWKNDLDCVLILLQYGIDPTTENHLGLTPLANLEQQSALRKRIHKLPSNHSLRRTVELLREAEALVDSDNDSSNEAQDADDEQESDEESKRSSSDDESISSASSWSESELALLNETSWTDWLLEFGGFFSWFKREDKHGDRVIAAPVGQGSEQDENETD